MQITDPTGRTIEFSGKVNSLISVVPSQTELLYDLGLGDKVTAHTLFCVHPCNAFKSKPKIGGTKKLDVEKIAAFKPDLILANKEENVKEQIEWLAQRFPVWVSDVVTLKDAVQMIKTIGELTHTAHQASKLCSDIACERRKLKITQNRKVLYLIWKDPWMTVGGDTFINHMLEEAGFENIMQDKSRYPEVKRKELIEGKFDCIFLSSEPFPFREKHKKELEQLTGKPVHLVDGEMFSWYGSRMVKSFLYFNTLQKQITL